MTMLVYPESQRVLQWGIEATPGTRVAAPNMFATMTCDIDDKRPQQEVQKQGSLLPVGNVPSKGRTDYKPKCDAASVQDLIVLFAAAFGGPVFTQTGTLAYEAEFVPNNYASNVPKTLTVEDGWAGSGLARVGTEIVVDGLEMDFMPDKAITFSGSAFGQLRALGETLTAAPVSLPKSILLPKLVDVYLATDETTLLDNKIDNLSVKFKAAKLRGDVYGNNSDDPSYSTTVDTKPNLAFDIVVPRNPAADAYLASIDEEAQYFIEVVAQGREVETGFRNFIKLRCPVQFTNPGESIVQDVRASSFSLNVIQDDEFNTTGGFLKATFQSSMTALPS